jgi:uncharacterized repeat protein (TIGR01451 family)
MTNRLARILALLLCLFAATTASAAITIDVTTSKDASSASSTITTPVFSTTAGNELLLAFIATDYSSGTNVTVTSVTGSGLTWVLVVRTNVQSGTSEIWRALAPAPLTNVTATATLSQSVAASLTVMSFSGADTSGINGAGAIGATRSANARPGAPTASLVTTRANSWVLGVGNDYDNAVARTPGTGQSLVHQYLAAIGDTYWVQRQNSPTPVSGTTVTINDTAPTADRYNLSAVEILANGGEPSPPDLTLNKTHAGNFVQGQSGASYTITATNSGGSQTSGTVTVTDGLPAGLTATAISGTNWNCALPTLTCTRSDVLAAGASYPAITLTVNVAANAPASVTNTATISGGGESNTTNNSASDTATVGTTGGGLISHVGGGSAHPVVTNQVMTFNYTPAGTNDAVVVMIGCITSNMDSMVLSAPGWTFTPISGLIGPSGNGDFIGTFGAITPNTVPVTFTVTFTGGVGNCSSDASILVDEFAGTDTTGGTTTFDAHNESFSPAVSVVCTGAPVTPANTNDAIWYACYDNVTGVSGGYTKGQDDTIGDWTEYKVLSGGLGVVQNASFATTSNTFALAGVSIKAASAAASAPDLVVSKTHSGSFVQGQIGATYFVAVTNGGSTVTSGTVTVTDTLPTGLTATAIGGTNWSCTLATLTCTRSDLLPAGASYPAITVTVNVANSAPATVTNNATVSGGGENNTVNDTASDLTTVTVPPDLTITKSHTGNFVQGQVGATYRITVTNSGSTPTSGTVTIADTLPSGLTATAMSGTNWSCTLTTRTCTRSDGLAAGSSYPVITLTVTVASSASASLTNTVSVSGGGETNTTNNIASDVTTITAPADLTVTKSHAGNFVQGQTGSYTITATNSGSVATSGTVTVVDTLPSGLTASAISGTNWNCMLTTRTCTRSDALAAGASYPAITVTVNVASNAPDSVTNTVTVSGGGEIDTANDTANDVTSIATNGGTSGISRIQSNVNGNESGTNNMSVSFPSNNTQGNFLIVTGSAARPARTLSVSDTLGNTYVPAIGPVTDVAQDVTIYIWYVPICKGGANTVTITPSNTAALEIHVSEWSGIAPSSPVDQIVSATGTGTSVSSGSRTTTASGELIFGYGWVLNTATAGPGFMPISLVNGDLDEYQIQTTAGSVAATFTQASGTWFALLATFRPAVSDTTLPVVSVTAPLNGATVAGITTVSASATDNISIAGVRFQLDGGNLGAEVTSSPYSIAWDTSATGDGSHNLTAIARDTAGNLATSATVAVTVSNASNPAVVGQWGTPFELGIVAVNAVMLHTGKVLMYSGSYSSAYVERVWDPVTGTITLVPNPYYNLFCSGQAQLPDGRILVVGGYDPPSLGAANANIFDPVTQSWSALPNMAYRRWYPTATGLPDGRMLVTSGGQTCLTCLADLPEVFDPATGRFSTLTTARLAVPYYPFMFVLPDGKIIDAGANENPVATSKLDVVAGTWTTVDPVVKDGHSAAMYQPGKILKSGTAADSGTSGSAAATAYVFDTTQPSPSWRQVASMAYPRAFHNTTLLPDGNVLVTGGGTMLDGYDVSKATFHAELWSPVSETWQTLSSASIPRLYHSTALLLPDGRVLTAGSGDDGPAIDQTKGEIFSPPYLFKGARPTISSAPGLLQYGNVFTVSTPDAANIASVVLIRPGAVTHAFDEDQRLVNLGFTAGTNSLTIQAPANANLAPPGYYMLFLVNSAGVPSVASFVQFAAPGSDSEPPTPPSGLGAQGAIGSATLTWGASTDNTGIALYNIHRSTTSGFQPSSANRVGQSTSTGFTNSGVAAGTYYYLVTAQDVVGNISAPSNQATAIVLADTTAPTVTMTAPAQSATVTGSITVSANASDDVGVAGVQFQLDGQALGSERTAPPYSVTWNSATTSNGPHVLTAVARDASGNSSQAVTNVTVSNTSQTPNGLVAAYGFNEGSGVQTTDASGQGHTGTISSATWTAAGKFGSALSFNGTSAWVTVADAASLDLTTGLTIEAWINPTSGTGWRSVILKEGASALAYALYSNNNASRPAGYVHTNSDIAVNGIAAVPLSTWTHLALTYDGATMRMFVNGVQVSTKALTGSASVTSGALRIGGNSVWGEYFRGLIDEIRIYNRPLTGGEIQTDMATPLP